MCIRDRCSVVCIVLFLSKRQLNLQPKWQSSPASNEQLGWLAGRQTCSQTSKSSSQCECDRGQPATSITLTEQQTQSGRHSCKTDSLSSCCFNIFLFLFDRVACCCCCCCLLQNYFKCVSERALTGINKWKVERTTLLLRAVQLAVTTQHRRHVPITSSFVLVSHNLSTIINIWSK